MKMLVVDDEIVSRKKMMRIINAFGICEDAESGKAALDLVKTALSEWKLYDLITLDVSLPDISGIDVLSSIRKMEKGLGMDKEEQTKILMVTAHSDMKTVKACAGKCDGYVIKPFNREGMVDKFKKLGLLR
jgi:two-component system, chemotaxis family, chemotaxis protein CheY